MNLQEISDRLEIQEAVHGLVRGFDARDREAVEHLLADEVVTDYTAMLGGAVETRTARQQVQYYRDHLDHLDASMHAATTLLVDLDGDSATATVNILTWLRRDAAPAVPCGRTEPRARSGSGARPGGGSSAVSPSGPPGPRATRACSRLPGDRGRHAWGSGGCPGPGSRGPGRGLPLAEALPASRCGPSTSHPTRRSSSPHAGNAWCRVTDVWSLRLAGATSVPSNRDRGDGRRDPRSGE